MHPHRAMEVLPDQAQVQDLLWGSLVLLEAPALERDQQLPKETQMPRATATAKALSFQATLQAPQAAAKLRPPPTETALPLVPEKAKVRHCLVAQTARAMGAGQLKLQATRPHLETEAAKAPSRATTLVPRAAAQQLLPLMAMATPLVLAKAQARHILVVLTARAMVAGQLTLLATRLPQETEAAKALSLATTPAHPAAVQLLLPLMAMATPLVVAKGAAPLGSE